MPATIPLLKLGRFTIESEIKLSDSINRFEAHDGESDRPVHIYQFDQGAANFGSFLNTDPKWAEIERQIDRIKSLSGPRLLAVYDFFHEDGQYFLVTARVEGDSLLSLIAGSANPHSTPQSVQWADDILEGLTTLHSNRNPQVHGAIRPSNIVVGLDGRASLLLAPMCFPELPYLARGSEDLGVESPSLAYSPLEFIWNGLDAASRKVILSRYDETSEWMLTEDPNAASDIYSLGATFYHLLTARVPSDPLERSIEMIEGNPDPLVSPHQIDPSIPQEISDVVMKSLEIRPNFRFDSAAIMKQVLKAAVERIREREPGSFPALTPKSRVKKPLPSSPSGNGTYEDFARRLREAEEKLQEASRQNNSGLGGSGTTPAIRVFDPVEVLDLDSDDDLLGILAPPAAKGSEPKIPSGPQSIGSGTHAEETEVSLDKKDDHEIKHPPQEPSNIYISRDGVAGQFEDREVVAPVPDPDAQEKVKPYTQEAGALTGGGENTLRSSKGLLALGAAALVLCAIAVGWMFLGGPKHSEQPPIVAAPVEDQQSRTEHQALTLNPDDAADQGQINPPVTESAPSASVTLPAKPQPAPTPVSTKPKRSETEPARTPVQKRKITVDDLINDN